MIGIIERVKELLQTSNGLNNSITFIKSEGTPHSQVAEIITEATMGLILDNLISNSATDKLEFINPHFGDADMKKDYTANFKTE